VYLLREDARRASVLALNDASLQRKYPWIGYSEPEWRRGVPQLRNQDRFRRWQEMRMSAVE
jgi:hypothetical protein